MTEEVTLEDLQKQVLELQKQLEEQRTRNDANEKKLASTESDLKKARDLNAELFSKVPGDTGESPKKDENPYDAMSDEEFIQKSIEALVDGVAHQER